MTYSNITINLTEVKDMLMKSDLNSYLKAVLVIILNQHMEHERDQYMDNKKYEHDANRHDYRNGYYEREYLMNLGRVTLKVPRTRSGEFDTEVFEKYQRCDQALLLSLLEMFVNGVATRKITNIVKQLCGESVSKSMVSELTKRLDPIVKEWSERPLNTINIRYIYVDAMYIKVRENDKVVSKAVYIALGVRDDGKREILGMQISHAETEKNWSEFFDYLIGRGLSSPRMVISDAHTGLRKAIEKKFIGTAWQRCSVHFRKNVIDKLPKQDSEEFKKVLRNIFEAPNLKVSRLLKEELFSLYENNKKFEKALEVLDDGYDDATQFYNEPVEAHVHIRSTNVLERLNGEVRRREKNIRIFPNHQSAFRLIGAVLMDCEEQFDPGNRRYIYFENN